MTLRDEVLEALRVHGSMDDDQLGGLLQRNRHYVNAVCRRLVDNGLARRVQGPDGKLVTELVSDLPPTPAGSLALTDASRTVRSPRQPRQPRQLRARKNVEALVSTFDDAVRRFEASNAFPGPSLYFHVQAIARRRRASSIDQLFEDDRFWEYVYAVLPAWGMHRMGAQAAKVGEFHAMVDSFDAQRDALAELFEQRLTLVESGDRSDLAESIWNVIANLSVSTSRTRIVAGSKALHHVLPDLVAPIDRQYTFRFFTGQKSIAHGDRAAFLEWFPLLCEVAARCARQIEEALQREGFMATGEAKVVDNAIIGFMQADAG
jgi:hypothetical protein